MYRACLFYQRGSTLLHYVHDTTALLYCLKTRGKGLLSSCFHSEFLSKERDLRDIEPMQAASAQTIVCVWPHIAGCNKFPMALSYHTSIRRKFASALSGRERTPSLHGRCERRRPSGACSTVRIAAKQPRLGNYSNEKCSEALRNTAYGSNRVTMG